MSTIKKEIESRGSNVEAAIRIGLDRLKANREDVVIEVVDEGSRGLLGLGSRDAVVRLKVVSYLTPEPKATEPPKPEPRPEPKLQPRPQPKPAVRVEPKAMAPQEVAPREVAPREAAPQEVAPQEVAPQEVASPPPVVPPPPVVEEKVVSPKPPVVAGEEGVGEGVGEGETAVSIITQLLDMMAFSDLSISAVLSEEDDLTGERIDMVQIEGDDLGILIGPRGETLDSLQYISRLMVSHKRRERANFVVDVQKYRERRQLALARLAERMAQKAIQRNQPVTLEPMPAHERRIIHMALRNSNQVYTNSAGEGERRRVKIFPK